MLVRLRFGLFIRSFGVIRQIQRAFLAAGRNKTSDRDKRSKRRDQALHGEILCKSINCARVYRPPGSLPMRWISRLAGLWRECRGRAMADGINARIRRR
ncbi:hypothetical protein ALQ15_110766 [Pseudomonas syringae pv. actinidiae]|uniref:Uncharacterized protein n=1 Tax=Pseudomonas syringae pv. actinidiae TaxID=103796 RepID=A0A7Z6UC07_PSESF|nr:hypothetical protein ALQ15_110766 [Pseudomonas syringae pv. actinidiae]